MQEDIQYVGILEDRKLECFWAGNLMKNIHP